MSVVTTLLAPITERSRIVTPLATTTFAPHQTLSPMRVGPFDVNPCQVTGRPGSSKRWLPSVTKQPLASMQWLPISTRPVDATITPMLRNVPSPMRTRAAPGAVIHTFGSSSVPAPISSRPSRSASSTLPWTGQRTNASRAANSQWIRARFHGSALRSYQRHFCHHSLARRASMAASWRAARTGGAAQRAPPAAPPGAGLRSWGRLLLVAVDHGLAVAHPRVLAPDEDGVEAGAAIDGHLGADDGEHRVVAGAAEHLVRALAAQADLVVAGAAEDHVRALAALEVVVALVADDAVRAATAVDRVVAEATLEQVAGAEAVVVVQAVAPDDVVAAVAGDVVRAVAAEQVVVAVRAGARAGAVLGRHPGRALRRVGDGRRLDDVLAARDLAAAQRLGVRDAARAAVRVDDDRVVAVAAGDAVDRRAVVDVDDVVARAGVDEVGARVGVDDVVAVAAVDVVGARAAVDEVVAVARGDRVGGRAAVDGVVAGAAVERVVAEAAVQAVVAVVGGQAVVARAAVEDVVAGAAGERVVAGLAVEAVGAGAAGEDIGALDAVQLGAKRDGDAHAVGAGEAVLRLAGRDGQAGDRRGDRQAGDRGQRPGGRKGGRQGAGDGREGRVGGRRVGRGDALLGGGRAGAEGEDRGAQGEGVSKRSGVHAP